MNLACYTGRIAFGNSDLCWFGWLENLLTCILNGKSAYHEWKWQS